MRYSGFPLVALFLALGVSAFFTGVFMDQEALLQRVKRAARELDTLMADIREFTYVDLKALGSAERQAQIVFLALTLAVQGIHESS